MREEYVKHIKKHPRRVPVERAGVLCSRGDLLDNPALDKHLYVILKFWIIR